MIAQRISMVNGVAQVQVFGATKYAVRVQVDPNKLAAARSASTKSSRPCATGTSIFPPARCYGPTPSFNIKANGQLMNAADYKPLIVA